MLPPWIRPWTRSLNFLVIYTTWWADLQKRFVKSTNKWNCCILADRCSTLTKKYRVLSSDMLASVLSFLCIPQISRLPALGPTIKRLQIPRSVFLTGLLRVEEIEKTFLTEIRQKVGKRRKQIKVLRMEFSIVENLSGLQESIFSLSRGPHLHFGEKSKKGWILLNLSID